jgi:uncharacterized damage-inducible protein DinB
MEKIYRPGAIGALMDEYEKAIAELDQCIKDISDEELVTIVDATTADANCHSIQTILTHVVHAAYGYATFIKNYYGYDLIRPGKKPLNTIKEYTAALAEAFQFTLTVFEKVNEVDLMGLDPSKKIKTTWGQDYDIEQMAEHAIVHILRHRRQIEKFKCVLRKS